MAITKTSESIDENGLKTILWSDGTYSKRPTIAPTPLPVLPFMTMLGRLTEDELDDLSDLADNNAAAKKMLEQMKLKGVVPTDSVRVRNGLESLYGTARRDEILAV